MKQIKKLNINEHERLWTALFMLIRNNAVMPTGLRLGKDMAEINRMSYEAALEIMTSVVDCEGAYRAFCEGRDKYWKEKNNV